MAKSLALGARHHGGSSPLYPTNVDLAQRQSTKLLISGSRYRNSESAQNACVVQLVEFRSPKPKMKVRVLTCVQQYPSGGMVYTAVLETVSKGVSVRVRPWVHIVL